MDFLEKGRVLWFQSLFREFTLCYKIRNRLLGQVYHFSFLIWYPYSFIPSCSEDINKMQIELPWSAMQVWERNTCTKLSSCITTSIEIISIMRLFTTNSTIKTFQIPLFSGFLIIETSYNKSIRFQRKKTLRKENYRNIKLPLQKPMKKSVPYTKGTKIKKKNWIKGRFWETGF